MVFGANEFLGHDNVEHFAMRKALNARAIHFAIKVNRLGLFRKYHRGIIEMAGSHAGNSDTRSLDGKNFIDGGISEQALEFRTHRIKQLDIDAMVQKTVNLQNALGLHHAVTLNAIFEKLHALPFLLRQPARYQLMQL